MLETAGVTHPLRLASLGTSPASGGGKDPFIPAIAPDGAFYPIGKMEAHRRGLLHVAISIFVMSLVPSEHSEAGGFFGRAAPPRPV